MSSWPATLPNPQMNGYALALADPVARTPFADGLLRARERSAAPPSRIQVTYLFTEPELAVFESWFRHVALDGAAWFDTPLATSQGIVSLTAQFAEDWRLEAAAVGFVITAALLVRALPLA